MPVGYTMPVGYIMPVGYARADRDPVPQGDDMRGLPEGTRLTKDGVDA
jgi:hypothetical protein